MKIEKIFIKERIIYVLFSFFPVLIWAGTDYFDYNNGFSISKQRLMIEAGVYGSVILFIFCIQLYTKIKLKKAIDRCNEKGDFVPSNRDIKRKWLLITDNYIVEYKMFKKRIIPIEGIFAANYKDELSGYYGNAFSLTRSMRIRKANINLIRIGQKQDQLNVKGLGPFKSLEVCDEIKKRIGKK